MERAWRYYYEKAHALLLVKSKEIIAKQVVAVNLQLVVRTIWVCSLGFVYETQYAYVRNYRFVYKSEAVVAAIFNLCLLWLCNRISVKLFEILLSTLYDSFISTTVD